MIGRHAVGTQQCEVFDVGGGFDLLAINRVDEIDRLRRLPGARENAARTALRRRRGGHFPWKARACRD